MWTKLLAIVFTLLAVPPVTLQSFLSDLCEVEDFHESLQLEEYIALCRQDIAIEITVAEMACIHSLLLKYRSDIVSWSIFKTRVCLCVCVCLKCMSATDKKLLDLSGCLEALCTCCIHHDSQTGLTIPTIHYCVYQLVYYYGDHYPCMRLCGDLYPPPPSCHYINLCGMSET